jgi:hypothetical protein
LRDDQDDNPGGPIDTWIFWITTPVTPEDSASRYIHYGGTIRSSTVDVQFESWVSGGGVSHVELKIDNGKYKRLAPPNGEDNGYSYSYRTITGLSDGTHTIYARTVDKAGNVDPTPAKWTFTVKKDKSGGYPDTWINWVRATPRGVNIANGGSTPSSTVIVDFQGTVSGRGSHIDLKIDNGPWKPVASPHTITGLSDGPHTICLKAVNQAGKADPTPACWKFTVINGNDNDDCDHERLHEARVKVEKNFTPVEAGVMRVREDDQACEILVTVRTEQHVKAFPISSMDGFPIRVEVGYVCPLGADGRQQQQEQEQSRDPSCPPLTFPIPGPGNGTGGSPPTPPPTPPLETNATAPGNATIPEGPGEFGPVVPPPFVPDDNQTQPGEEGSSRAEEE